MRSLFTTALFFTSVSFSLFIGEQSPAQAPLVEATSPREVTWRELTDLDETCADCHPKVVEIWRQSPMGSSFKRLPIKRSESAPRLLYQITHKETGHRYSVTDHGGALLFKQAKGEVSDERWGQIAIGGTHAETYLWASDDALFEAPLTRYDGQWSLSPGYDQRDQGLYRPITPGCLQCHAEPVDLKPHTLNRYERLPSRGIGCARCHGDARAHVKGRLEGLATPALTVKQMGQSRAHERCDQCHYGGAVRVTRSGKQWTDYRPGERLSDTIAIFTREERARGLSSVSHRDRLNLSVCSQGDQALDCTTCHPPHSQRVADPNASCVGCHSAESHPALQKDQGSDQALKPSLSSRCVDCHMRREGLRNVPHLSTLDHWIRKRPIAEPKAQDSEAKLIWVNRPEGEINAKTRARDQLLLGRAYYKAWRQGGQLTDLRRAYESLTSGLSVDQGDSEAWFTLAELTSEVSLSGQLPALRGEVGARVAVDAAERAWRLQSHHSEPP